MELKLELCYFFFKLKLITKMVFYLNWNKMTGEKKESISDCQLKTWAEMKTDGLHWKNVTRGLLGKMWRRELLISKSSTKIHRCQEGKFLLTQMRSELSTLLCLLRWKKMLHRRCGLRRVNTKNSHTCLWPSEIPTDFPFQPSFLTYIKALTSPPLPVSSPKHLWPLLSHSITSVSPKLIQQLQWLHFGRVTKPLNSRAFATKIELKQLQWYPEESN